MSIFDENLLEDWTLYLHDHKNYSKNTVLSYRKDVELFIDYINNNHYLFPEVFAIKDLKRDHVNSWLGSRSDFTARANARTTSSLKNFFKYLFLIKKEQINEELFLIKGPKYTRGLPRDLSREDMKFSEIMNLGSEDHEYKWIELSDKAIILLLYGAGLRISEALSVNFQNLNEEDMLLTVVGKGGKIRVVPILPLIIDVLYDYIECCPFIDNSNFRELKNIFFTKRGEILTRNNFAMRLKRSIANYNLPYKTSPHSFRHSFATHLLENGTNLKELQELLGHTKLSSTEIYTNVSDRLLKEFYHAAHNK